MPCKTIPTQEEERASCRKKRVSSSECRERGKTKQELQEESERNSKLKERGKTKQELQEENGRNSKLK
ncbi:hypothetical protein FH972_024978 [Carpinus fangiana]|uniref:Uncharacterized protein n=1 Tax=Carpinus fangiana TaxID=176857 RepID=A0A5N6KZP4_9ROSI|nr:hypothetical protein FH972_024978 [Carpinus fangiana]